MQVRRLAGARGLQWILDAMRLLRARLAAWFALHAALLAVGLLCSAFPPVGPYLFCLLTPLLMGGILQACRDQVLGKPIGLGHFRTGFLTAPEPLVTVGGVSLLGYVVVAGVVGYLGGDDLPKTLAALLTGADAEALSAESVNRAAMALLVGCALFVPIASAVWFAPALVLLGQQQALPSLALSLRACLANMIPLLVYGMGLSLLSMAVNLVAALLPEGPVRSAALVTLLVPMVALASLSTYFAYRDCFTQEPPSPTSATTPTL